MIIHGPRPQRDFTILPNRVLRDDLLSYRARGLLAFLLSQPMDWEVSSERLALDAGEGRDAVRTALKELINVGYLKLVKAQDERGYWASNYTVTADPWDFPEAVDSWPEPVDNSLTGD